MNLSRKLYLVATIALFALASSNNLNAQELSLSGSVDTYFRMNLNSTNDNTDGGTLAPGTSFAKLPGFALGMANIIASMDGENTGFVADLVFGPRGTEAVFGSTTASSSIVNQLYAYWNVSDDVTLTIGNFNTFLGYEVISPTVNFNYSTSYMFSYGPFSHSGLKADFALGDASLMLGVFNETDMTDFNPAGLYFGGAQVGYGGQYLNFLVGDDYFQVDFTGGLDVSEVTYVGLNTTFNNDLFAGAALYLQQSLSDDFSLGVRGEYWGVSEDFVPTGNGLTAATSVAPGESVFDLTFSANYKVGSLTLIPELRVDAFSQDVIIPEAGESAQSSLASFLVAAVYSF